MRLALVGNTILRAAITRNIVSFPAQVRPFMKRGRGDIQERIAQLYFIRGWPVRSLCGRYGLSKAMVHKLIAQWRIRAIESGYIQEIDPAQVDELLSETSASQFAWRAEPIPEQVPGAAAFSPGQEAGASSLAVMSGV